jgi:hypothetical protein
MNKKISNAYASSSLNPDFCKRIKIEGGTTPGIAERTFMETSIVYAPYIPRIIDVDFCQVYKRTIWQRIKFWFSYHILRRYRWKKFIFPIIKNMPNHEYTKELVNVQPMNLPSGTTFYMDFKTSVKKKPWWK